MDCALTVASQVVAYQPNIPVIHPLCGLCLSWVGEQDWNASFEIFMEEALMCVQSLAIGLDHKI